VGVPIAVYVLENLARLVRRPQPDAAARREGRFLRDYVLLDGYRCPDGRNPVLTQHILARNWVFLARGHENLLVGAFGGLGYVVLAVVVLLLSLPDGCLTARIADGIVKLFAVIQPISAHLAVYCRYL